MMRSHLAAAEADCDDADIVAVWQELWLDCGSGRHGVWRGRMLWARQIST